jgi:hypothetical protein
MNRLVHRTNVDGLVRDISTSSIINTNDSEYMNILKEREKAKRLAKLESDVQSVKDELRNIKNLIANRDH